MKGLLVEDNKADVNLIRLALKRFASDVELQVVDDGVKALDYLRRQGPYSKSPRPDFILLDLKLPRRTGLEVLSRIKQDPDLRRIPVIALTSSRAAADVGSAYDLQVAAYFVKPVTGLEDTIEAIIRFLRAAVLPGDGPARGSTEPAPPDPAAPPRPAGGGDVGAFDPRTRERIAEAIVRDSSDPIISVTLDGTISSWNEAAEALYGFTADEAIGRSIRMIVPEEGVAELESVLRDGRRGRATRHFETVRLDRAGRKIAVSKSVSPIRDGRGEVVGLSLIALDVTETRQREDRLRLAVERSPSAIVMVDPGGGILLVNTETERLFGYSRSELLGKSVDMLVPQRFRAQHSGHRAAFMARPEARAMGAGRELYGLRKDGSEFPVEIGLNPILTESGTLVLSAIVDITERKRTQEALALRTKELARSNAELEQFAYVASHDLQEPLRTVASYTRLLADQYAGRLDDEGKSYVQYAREGAIRMQSLIDALLAFSRIGTRGREPTAVDSGEALRLALENLRASIDESGARIVMADLPTISADPTQMTELFQNLVGNAIKFRGPKPPKITIAARRRGAEWIFSVADNGIGIDSQYFDRIFQVFQRLHGKEEYPGTGIGLAICKRIVERLGGRIWVESTPGGGAIFSFTVPVPSAEAPPHT